MRSNNGCNNRSALTCGTGRGGSTGRAAATSARGGEEGRSRGLKLCPPRVLAMLGCLDLGRDGEGGRISSLGKEME